MKIVIYHNPRCSKSRETLQILEEKGMSPVVVEYLKNSPTEDEIRDILKKLGLKAEQIIRKGESLFKEQYRGKEFSEDEWLRILAENPVLIERPIVIKGDRAVLCRPPQNVIDLID